MTSYYALTISPSYRPKTIFKEDLDKILNFIQRKARSFRLINKTYEVSSNNYLHMHATLVLSKSEYIPRLLQRGFSIRIDRLPTTRDAEIWNEYIHKHLGGAYYKFKHILQQNIIEDHYLSYHNLFNRGRERGMRNIPVLQG